MSLVTADPAEHGLDPARLDRITTHFQGYVDDGRLPGWQLLVARHGELVVSTSAGWRDTERTVPWGDDPIVRLFSMTKPVTSVAAMMLYEQGGFELKDPVSRFIPAFADARVYRTGSAQRPQTDPVVEPMRIWHLLTHTSGLTYGFHHSHVTDALYRAAGYDWGMPSGRNLAEHCDAWAALPLAFQPGSEWLYGHSTDVLGRVVEVASGMPLDEFFRAHIFEPLGMHETWFRVPDEHRDRCADLWIAGPDGTALPGGGPLLTPEGMGWLSGGGGLWGTAHDYLKFAAMLLGRGAAATPDGPPVRLLGTRTVDYMTRNHLPGGADLERFGRPLFAETTFDGVGFGLGVAVVDDPVANRSLASRGEYTWGGAASTVFWNDPAEQISAVFLTQLLPSQTHPIRSQLRQLVNQALVD